MGSFCCCFGVLDIVNCGNENGSNNTTCPCLNCCIRNIKNKYEALFARGRRLPVPTSNQETISSDSLVAHNISSVSRSCDRTLPMNPNLGNSPLPQEALVRRQDKGSNHSRIEPEPPNNAQAQQMPRVLKVKEKSVNANDQRKSKECCTESSLKNWSSSLQKGIDYAVSSSEDEDVCPTCLEEYTPENPKIITLCFHHYHLSCIFEWMERSETCPVCGKLMEFNETT